MKRIGSPPPVVSASERDENLGTPPDGAEPWTSTTSLGSTTASTPDRIVAYVLPTSARGDIGAIAPLTSYYICCV